MSGFPRQFIQKHPLSVLPGRAYTLANTARASHSLSYDGLEYFLRESSSREQQVLDDEDRKDRLTFSEPAGFSVARDKGLNQGLEDVGKWK